MSLRFLVTASHGYSPFLVTFKQEPVLPISAGWHPPSEALRLEDDASETRLIEELIMMW